VLQICAKRGVEKVRITGGEPLLRKGIIGFVERLSMMPGLADLSLTTNGMLLKPMAVHLKRAGLKRVNVSLDTLDRTKFAHITRVDAFEQVIKGICEAHEQQLSPVKINVVAIRGFNDDEIPDFVRLTLDLPVEVRFIELMPIGCITKYQDHGAISASEIHSAIENVYGTLETLEGGLGPARIYRVPGARGTIGIIGSLSEHDFCGACNRIRITARGHLRPCLFSERHIDLLTPMRNGISDEELEGLIEDGVRAKPPAHGVCRGVDLIQQGPRTKMSDIGG
jgi:GTP 3',8-cyclase